MPIRQQKLWLPWAPALGRLRMSWAPPRQLWTHHQLWPTLQCRTQQALWCVYLALQPCSRLLPQICGALHVEGHQGAPLSMLESHKSVATMWQCMG